MSIAENLDNIRKTISLAAGPWGRVVADINLIAVSKKQPMSRILEALEAGQRVFGENRVQEAKERWLPLKAQYLDLELHLIGPLQTNKVKDAVALFDMIHTVDREKLVNELAKEMKKQNRYLPCLIQVNTGAEEQKAGVDPRSVPNFLEYCRAGGLDIRGLMCIPPVDDAPALHFAFLRKIAQENNLPDLSMGMSDDFEKAVPLGATYLRVGSALFGERVSV